MASAMIVASFPVFGTEVHAADDTVPKYQFATVDELKAFNTNDSDADGKNPAKVYFGYTNFRNEKQQWWIVGNDTKSKNGKDNLVLYATEPLLIGLEYFANRTVNWATPALWQDCTYPNGNPREVYPNHYGASDVRRNLRNAENNKQCFTADELKLMNSTTIYTNDTKYQDDHPDAPLEDSVYSTTERLYLPYGKMSFEDPGQWEYITVGTNEKSSLNSGLRIDNYYWRQNTWLRAPYPSKVGDNPDGEGSRRKYVLVGQHVASGDSGVNKWQVMLDCGAFPAFELNLSSVIFASAAQAASGEGELQLEDTNPNESFMGAFILRYKAENLGSALVSYDKISFTDVPVNTYLVVQNSDGAYAKQIKNEASVSASDINIKGPLTSFENCKVWLERTDTTQRMTYATLADEGTYKITVDSNSFTFDTQHIGYSNVSAHSFQIKNTGNVEAAKINAALTGTNADAFTLDTAGMQNTLAPNETTAFTVKPNAGLGAGTYTAELQITGEAGIIETISISFTVEDHEYGEEWKYNETNHWKECKNCGNKSEEAQHTFKEIIDKEPTETEKGSKHEECEICGYKNASVEIPVKPTEPDQPTKPDKPTEPDKPTKPVKPTESDQPTKPVKPTEPDQSTKPDQPTEPGKLTEPDKTTEREKTNTVTPNMNQPNDYKGSVETGDRTDLLLWEVLVIGSGIILVYGLYRKKRKINQ